MSLPPFRYIVLRQLETDPPEVFPFREFSDAEKFYDRAQLQWTGVYLCEIVRRADGAQFQLLDKIVAEFDAAQDERAAYDDGDVEKLRAIIRETRRAADAFGRSLPDAVRKLSASRSTLARRCAALEADVLIANEKRRNKVD